MRTRDRHRLESQTMVNTTHSTHRALEVDSLKTPPIQIKPVMVAQETIVTVTEE